MQTADIVIRGGMVVDGTGAAPRRADVAVRDGVILAIGGDLGLGAEEIDATGLLVTPGFVDVHTHYDAQATWEETLQPSSLHGVTTVVTGNCGVGFAPCRPGDRELMIAVMEGVEDIPQLVMAEGLPWSWESFSDYLDFIDTRRFDIDIGVQVPHSAIRVYVMGERGAKREPATAEDLAAMRTIVREAVDAGAIGVSTSRLHFHRSKAGDLAPSIDSADEELLTLARGLRDAGRGVFQMIADVDAPVADEFALMRRIAKEAEAALSFTLLQRHSTADDWRDFLDAIEDAQADGLMIRGQIFPRPVGVLQGLQLTLNPFSLRPSYKAIADRPLAEKVAIMRDPAFRARLLTERPDHDPNPMFDMLTARVRELFPLGPHADYAPDASDTVGGRADRESRSPLEVAYDLLLERDGQAILYLPASNFANNRLDAPRVMMEHPGTILGLGDGGAHYGFICDASYPSTVLAYWARDVEERQRISVGRAIELLARRPAMAVGLNDRGMLAPGYRADINLIDFDMLLLHSPTVSYDLPAGGRRIVQQAEGYRLTMVAGTVTYRDGIATGARPGRLVRGARPLPAMSAPKVAAGV
ncbi:N-acyl-D-amino-acid deacylase family protein [Rhizorhabdus wittichii]|uniref:N-acyl-D-amino-acid deacylase family protein n=1 Tax=Rhizorhabdus wittichii TaxID=160791 RepID=UPI000307E347|nr:amidohydrolase family protein [Rhizorhabdus wittichii]